MKEDFQDSVSVFIALTGAYLVVAYMAFMLGSHLGKTKAESSLEGLADWHSQQYPDATPWETCEQEVE